MYMFFSLFRSSLTKHTIFHFNVLRKVVMIIILIILTILTSQKFTHKGPCFSVIRRKQSDVDQGNLVVWGSWIILVVAHQPSSTAVYLLYGFYRIGSIGSNRLAQIIHQMVVRQCAWLRCEGRLRDDLQTTSKCR